MIKRLISATSILTIVVGIGFSGAYINSQAQTPSSNSLKESTTDSLTTDSIAMCDTICAADSLVTVNDSLRYTTLSEADYRRVAEELGVEVAAIKAVVLIEAGAALEGFLAPGVPVINFDAVMYRKMKSKDTRKAPSDASNSSMLAKQTSTKPIWVHSGECFRSADSTTNSVNASRSMNLSKR